MTPTIADQLADREAASADSPAGGIAAAAAPTSASVMQAAISALTAAGAPAATITAAKLLLARGRVFQAELEALDLLDDADSDDAADDRNFLECLDQLAHLIAQGVPLAPLVDQLREAR